MSVYNGILRSYFLLGTKRSFASNNDEKIVDRIVCFHAITSRRQNGFQRHVATSKTWHNITRIRSDYFQICPKKFFFTFL